MRTESYKFINHVMGMKNLVQTCNQIFGKRSGNFRLRDGCVSLKQCWFCKQLKMQNQNLVKNSQFWNDLSCSTTEPTIWPVWPLKTQISLSICPLWSVFAVCSMDSQGPSFFMQTVKTDQSADLSLCRSFCWFCHAVAHLWREVVCFSPV